MILVADSSALIALASCNALHHLEKIFGSVIVPQAVFDEVTAADKDHALALGSYLADKVRSVDMSAFVYLDAFADLGETQAMVLYKASQADYLLIDDKRGRRVAQLNQINIIGSLGVLVLAKRLGLVPAIEPLIAQITNSTVYIAPGLIDDVLSMVGER